MIIYTEKGITDKAVELPSVTPTRIYDRVITVNYLIYRIFIGGGVTVAHIPASMFPKKLFIVLYANLPVITLYTCQK